MDKLSEIALAAKAEGLTYGQYQAKYGKPVEVRKRRYRPGYCRRCGDPLEGRRTRYCSLTCQRAAEKEAREK